MERLLLEINDEIESKCRKIGGIVEDKHKLMIAKSYKCMSRCFDVGYSLDESYKCAKICKKSLKEAHFMIQSKVDEAQENIRGCIEDCVDVFGEMATNENVKCFHECKIDALKLLKEAKIRSRIWIGK
ncbi:hypothetical protein SteCoe_36323 [Stentor coeruleus]|uniref:Uncharacterized protein n=1 Tax=Stentor coeruleus TaxID=5963 RepID=A0A1R2AQE8_9CILI|nr:hypothetical protein SteCoe_36323 [Stentor coeruleus]